MSDVTRHPPAAMQGGTCSLCGRAAVAGSCRQNGAEHVDLWYSQQWIAGSAHQQVRGGCGWPARVLAESRAKRRIVELYRTLSMSGKDKPFIARLMDPSHAEVLDYCVREMGTVYADHPDYDIHWRPRMWFIEDKARNP